MFVCKITFFVIQRILHICISGHTRTVRIPGCVEFDVSTNACRGFCVSYSIPSSEDSLRTNPYQTITSFGECCNIMETEDVSKLHSRCIVYFSLHRNLLLLQM